MSANKPKPKARVPSRPDKEATPGTEPKRAPRKTFAQVIDQQIQSVSDWRAETLTEVRRIILSAAPDIVEERKWVKPTNPSGVPVWSHAGIVCTGETYKQVVKLTFARGASLPDPRGLFNSSLEGHTRRAIDLREGDLVDGEALKALIQAAIAENLRASAPKSKAVLNTVAEAKPGKLGNGKKVVLLSGGNPQIAKGDGDPPVQAYLAAIPGWKRDLGKRLDALIVRTVPDVRKAVKWNSPFYGIEGRGWFLSFHVFTLYLKVTFFSGTSLRPIPPGGTPKSKDSRWIDLYEGDELDETQMETWIRQAAALPGWVP